MSSSKLPRVPGVRTALSVAAIALSAVAQDPVEARLPTGLSDGLIVPLHRAPSDDGDAAPLWAVGPDYKVSFGTTAEDVGMRFFPVLGVDAPRNLPLAWRTIGVTRGSTDLLDAARQPREAGPLCFEIDHGNCVERYDVRGDGVYQSFVFAGPTAGEGDLVLHGAVETELRAAARSGMHAPLVFADAQGRETVRYGAAFALDAAGRRMPIDTAFDGTVVSLTVPEAWLADAVWPVTVDPLTSRSQTSISGATLASPVIARDDNFNRRMVVYRRASAGNDWDLFGRVMADDLSGQQTILSEVSAAVSVKAADVVAAGSAAGRWVVAMERETATIRSVGIYLHPKSDVNLNTGTNGAIPRPAGRHHGAPKLGGSRTDDLVLVAFESDTDLGGTDQTEVLLTVLDAVNGTLTPRRSANDVSQTPYDAEAVSVSQRGLGGDDQWVVAWQEFSHAVPNDDWDIQINRVNLDGTTDGMRTVTTDVPGNRHAQAPQLAGERGMFGLAYLSRDNTGAAASESGDRLVFRTIGWPSNNVHPTVYTEREIATDGSSLLKLDRRARLLAFDTRTDSHFALAYERRGLLLPAVNHELRVARLAWSGAVLESLVPEASAGFFAEFTPISTVFDDDHQTFALSYADAGGGGIQRVFGRDLEHPAASATTYGVGCQGNISFVNRTGATPPRAGSRFTQIALSGAAPGHPTWLFAAVGPADLPLPLAGNGCRLLLSTQIPLITVGNWIAPQNGVIEVDLELPASVAGADVYWQFLQLVGPTLRTSNGLHTAIR